MPINHKEIIDFIFRNLDKNDDAIIKELEEKFSLSNDDSGWAIEMYRTAAFRVGFIRTGLKYPKSNIDNDPFLKEAIKLILEKG